MSMFGIGNDGASVTAPVYEGYGVEVQGDVIALMEAHDDYEGIIEAMHGMAMAQMQPDTVLESLGASDIDVVKEGLAKNAFDKVKAFFSKLWGKLKAFFASAVRLLDALFKDGKAFAEKHQTEIRNLKVKGMEVKMFNYTNLDGGNLGVGAANDITSSFAAISSIVAQNNVEKLDEMIEAIREQKDDDLEAIRGKVVGSGALTAEEFRTELFAHFRDGAENKDDKEEIKVEPARLLEALKDTKPLKAAQDLEKKVNKEFSTVLSELKKIESKLSSAKTNDGMTASTKTAKGNGIAEHSDKLTSGVITFIQLMASEFAAEQKIQSDAFTAWRAAIQERSSTYKGVVLAAFRYKEKKSK